MPVSDADITELERINGAESSLGTPPEDPSDLSTGEPPYGMTFLGALTNLRRAFEDLDELGMTYADLPADSDRRYDIEMFDDALNWHIRRLPNLLSDGLVGQNDQIELPNGNTLDLPTAAVQGSNSANIPDPPGQK